MCVKGGDEVNLMLDNIFKHKSGREYGRKYEIILLNIKREKIFVKTKEKFKKER